MWQYCDCGHACVVYAAQQDSWDVAVCVWQMATGSFSASSFATSIDGWQYMLRGTGTVTAAVLSRYGNQFCFTRLNGFSATIGQRLQVCI
jgi:tRNA(Met) C34 N-acetyltransferase TmcA